MTNRSIQKEIFFNLLDKEISLAKNNFTQNISLSIDSRTLSKGSVFFCMPGENFDGHNFADTALKNGASLIVAKAERKNNFSHIEKENIIFVESPLKTYQTLARDHLRQFKNLKKLALTGSSGKTTVKEMTAHGLRAVLGNEKVYASAGNKNNHFGVALCAFEVTRDHEVALFEMGMNHAGEIKNLCEIIEPNIALINNISHAHSGNFADGIEGVQKAKGEIFAALKKDHIALYNFDDERVCYQAKKSLAQTKISFGFKDGADLQIISAQDLAEDLYQKIVLQVFDQTIEFSINRLEKHNAQNACAALSFIHALDLPLEKAAKSLAHLPKSLGRQNIFTTGQNILVIDDAYNANPDSMNAGISICKKFFERRKIAVVGAMGELGQNSDEFHFALGKTLGENFAKIFLCGNAAKPAALALKSLGREQDLQFAECSQELLPALKNELKKDDLVFIKGSFAQNMKVISDELRRLA